MKDTTFVTHREWNRALRAIEKANIKATGRSIAATSMVAPELVIEEQDDQQGKIVKKGWRNELKKRYLASQANITGIYKGEDARQIAERKSRYGRKYWLYWRDKEGNAYCGLRTKETLKAAMLACGTQGRFLCFMGDSVGWTINWSLAAMWLRNIEHYDALSA